MMAPRTRHRDFAGLEQRRKQAVDWFERRIASLGGAPTASESAEREPLAQILEEQRRSGAGGCGPCRAQAATEPWAGGKGGRGSAAGRVAALVWHGAVDLAARGGRARPARPR